MGEKELSRNQQTNGENFVAKSQGVNLVEQKKLFYSSFQVLIRATNDEIYGIDESEIRSNDLLRKSFSETVDSTKTIMDNVEWLYAGIYDRIPSVKLEEWATLKDPQGPDEKVQMIAGYLLKKKKAAEKK